MNNYDKYLNELFDFLKIASISSQTEHKKDMDLATKWLSEKLSTLGFETKIIPTDGHALVYGELLKFPNSPTILVYGHYDVQPLEPLDEWISKPFEPVVRDGNIYARGAADDKGQLYTWIAAVSELISQKKLNVNIKFIIEGEEEMGSRNFKTFLEKNHDLLKSDICVISDSHSLSTTQPLICYGLRGMIYTEISLKTLTGDVHSGIYGGNVANPIHTLVQILSKLKDENSKITIPGFYDDVRILETREIELINKYPFGEDQIKKETGATFSVGEEEFSIAARAGARPTLDENGIWGGYIQEGAKTVIPSIAYAKVSMRLVPNQKPIDIFEKYKKYLEELCPKYAKIDVKLLSQSNPVIMNRDSKYFKIAHECLAEVFGNEPLYELSGGSIGAAAKMKELVGVDSILMGYGLPDDNLHAPNEKLSVEMFNKGISSNINFLTKLV